MRILIGAPVRQDPHVFALYLESLRGLVVPDGVQVETLFILHNSAHLAKQLRPGECFALHNETRTTDYQVDETTHHWTTSHIREVTLMKNALLKHTILQGHDYFFLADSDLLLHPRTLIQLLDAQKDIVANVFWTKWNPDSEPAPNAWDMDHWSFFEGSLERWKQPGLYRVGMSGACILVHRRVLEQGINYDRVPNLSFWGEDRHFCVRAVHGYEIWLETTYPAQHLYRPSDIESTKGGKYKCTVLT